MKKNESKNESKHEPKAHQISEAQAPSPEERTPKLGHIVKWHKEIQSQSGTKFKTYAAIVSGFPEAVSNFQPKDMAVQLTVFGQQGVAVDQKYDVMYSAEPKAGRWSW